jgi:uncharacterized protein
VASLAPNSPGVRTARGIVSLRRRGGVTVCESCVVADRIVARMKGLMGRRAMAAGEGMLIRPAPSIHTFFMRFAIDAVFVSHDGEVLKVARNVRPWRASSCRMAYAVVELAAGEAERREIVVGDRIETVERPHDERN